MYHTGIIMKRNTTGNKMFIYQKMETFYSRVENIHIQHLQNVVYSVF